MELIIKNLEQQVNRRTLEMNDCLNKLKGKCSHDARTYYTEISKRNKSFIDQAEEAISLLKSGNVEHQTS